MRHSEAGRTETQHNDSPAETRLDVSQSRQSQSPRMTEQSPVLSKVTRQACDYASVKVIDALIRRSGYGNREIDRLCDGTITYGRIETFAMALRLRCVCLSFCRRGDLDFAAHEDAHKYDGDEDDPA